MAAKRSILLGVVFLAAACGGERGAEEQPAPKLPPALAQQLAAESDSDAQLLDAGDPCGAAERAAALQQRAIAALNTPRTVPDELKEDLGVAVADLVDRAQTECAAAQPPPAPPPTTTAPEADEDEHEEEGDGRGENGRGRGKGKGKKK